MDEHLDRAKVLIQRERYDRAAEYLRKALAEDPDDGHTYAWLGICLSESKHYDHAERALRESIRLDPEAYLPHYALGQVFLRQDRYEEAREAAGTALALDPSHPDAYALHAQIEICQENWQDALDWVDTGLGLDAEHGPLTNLRGMALTQLGRKDEAGHTIRQALRSEPESALAHANEGFRLLHANQPKRALEHFQEALRSEPGHEWARAGLVEALKAHYLIYRAILSYFLWMSRLPQGARVAVILGAYVFAQLLKTIVRNNEELGPILWPILGLYFVFVLLTWASEPLFNLLIRLNPYGRYALDRYQRLGSNAFAAFVLLGLGCVGLGFGLGSIGWYLAALVCGLLALVFGHALSDESRLRFQPMLFVVGMMLLCLTISAIGYFAEIDVMFGLGLVGTGLSVLAFALMPLVSASRRRRGA